MSLHVFEADVRHATPQPFMDAGPSLNKQDYSHSTTNGNRSLRPAPQLPALADGYFGPRVGSPPVSVSRTTRRRPVMREYWSGSSPPPEDAPKRVHGADGDEAILWAMLMAMR